MEETNILIAIDLQNDFTTGSLGIGKEKTSKIVDRLHKFYQQNYQKIKCLITTQDWHLRDHCSFKENGGIWPTHCVQNTMGSRIDIDIATILNTYDPSVPMKTRVVKKGKDKNVEEYGADIFSVWEYDPLATYYIFGIALEYCVIETINIMRKQHPNIKIICIKDAIAAINDSINIEEYLEKENLKWV